MRILLTTLNSKYIHTNLSLKYMYGIASELGAEADLQEFTINNERDYIFGQILRGSYDLVCFSCYIWNIEAIRTLASDLKKASPETEILLGGPEVSFDSVTFMRKNPWADYIIRGEGENAFRQFVQEMLSDDPDHQKVKSLTYRAGDSIVETDDAPLMDMDELPFPYEYLEVEPDKIVYYESSRGCPYRCSFCLSSIDKTVRTFSMERVRRDINYLIYKNVKQVKFIDRTFNFNVRRANELWQFIVDKDNGVTNFHFEIMADHLDVDSYRIISKARKGLFQFEVGFQTGNPHTLKAIGREGSAKEVLPNTARLVDIGNSHVHVDLIAGLPYEDYRSFSQSFNLAYQAGADNLQLGFLKLLRGTRMREIAKAHGYVYQEKAPYEVISNRYMSSMDLIKLKMVETVLELFHNRGGFSRSLEYLIEKTGTFPFRFYERLADFYFSMGYHHVSHKKEELYRILYQFAVRLDKNRDGIREEAQQCLLEDIKSTLNEDTVKRFLKRGWELK